MDHLISRSFKLDGSRSFSSNTKSFTRSNTSWLASELGSSLPSRFTAYQKLSDSMRFVDTAQSSSNYDRGSRNGAWAFVTKIFSLKKAGGDLSDRRWRSSRSSSWRPDPNRRWPVQGW